MPRWFVPWEPTPYALIGFVAAGISVAVAVTTYRHRHERGVRPFFGLLVALAGWSLASALQLGFTTRAEQLLWQRLGFTVGGAIPAFWLLFTLEYTGRGEWLTRRRRAILAVDPVVYAALTLSNPVHGLVWDGASLTTTAGGPVLTLSLNLGYYLHITYAYLLVTAGLLFLASTFVRASDVYRGQTGLLLLGALPPFLGNIAFTLRAPLGPLPGLDPTPFAFVVTGVLFGLALFRFDLLARTPVARRRVLEEQGDGLVVLDTAGEVVNTNRVARDVLDPPPAVGEPVTTLDAGGAETAEAALDALDEKTATATVDGRTRAYDLDWSPLTDRHGELVGHALALRDVTERNRYEQRLEVAMRVLRHNLRNEMTVIRGHADQLARTASDGQASTAETIVDRADDLIDLSEKTRTMMRLGQVRTERRAPVDVGDRVTDIVAEFRRAHPDVTIECDLVTDAEVRLPDGEFVEVPVRNLVENAVEHNDAPDPWVGVSLERGTDQFVVSVEDNGPSIPAVERDVLTTASETPLRHSSGVGLWLTYWATTAVGGSMAFETREPRGNVVVLTLPTTDRSTTV